jgi:outer membrane protein assembly factor BamB
MPERRLLALIWLLGGLVIGAAAADWPQFRGPRGDGISPEKGIFRDWHRYPPKLLWQAALTDEGYSGPAVAAGTLVIVDHKGPQDVVRAFDLTSGRERWHFAYTESERPNYGFTRSTPAISHGRVYTVSRRGWVHCLTLDTGRKVWARQIVQAVRGRLPQWDLAASPLIDEGRLIICPGGTNAAVVALDPLTGKTLWQGGGSDAPGYATPVPAVLDGVRQYVVFTAKRLIGVDAKSGRLCWQIPWETNHGVNAATPLVAGNEIFISSGYGRGCALVAVRGSSATLRWQNRELQAHFSSPILYNAHIYGTTDPGALVCLRWRDGRQLWRQSGFEKGGIVGGEGMLVALTGNRGDAVLVRLTPAGYQEQGRCTPLGGQSWTAPIIAEGKLIVRTKHTLACLTLK